MNYRVLDPTSETHAKSFSLAPRLSSLAGGKVGFISNGKEGTKGFFSHLERMLLDDVGMREVVWRTKANYSAPAENDIISEVKEWDAAISGIGD